MSEVECLIVDIAQARLDASAALESFPIPGLAASRCSSAAVRDLNHGRSVRGVSYDMFAPLAVKVSSNAPAPRPPHWSVHASENACYTLPSHFTKPIKFVRKSKNDRLYQGR